MDPLELKALPAEFKVEGSKRLVTGYASTFNVVDHGNDLVEPGAYTKTLAEDFPAKQIKVKRDHEHVIGLPIHMEQDSKGLLTVSRISQTALGNDTLILVEDGVIDRMSIGYKCEQRAYEMRDGGRIRRMQQVKLREYSLLGQPPMNDGAVVTGVKSLYDVARVLDQMSGALEHLRALSYVPADIAQRLATLIGELGPLVREPAPYVPDPRYDASPEALNALVGEFTALLSTSAR